MIWSYFNLGKTSEQCHDALFFGSESSCTLKHVKKLYRMFADRSQNERMINYLAKTNPRGQKFIGDNNRWYDGIINAINLQHPTIKVFDMRLRLRELLGGDETSKLPSLSSIGKSLLRCKAKRKRCTFLSNSQDPVQVFDHMERMRCIDVNCIVNWDETSAHSEKFRPTHGRGEGEVILDQWHIGDKTYSAIAALTTMGFLPCTKIFDVACSSSTIQQFLTGLEPFLLSTSVGLFDNASVNTCEQSLQAVDRVFGGKWARNAPYSPRLAPIEKGFSLVWNLVRQRWQEAQVNPIRVLEEAFKFYEVGSPGGPTCSSFFNVYRRNREEAEV